MGFLKPAGKIGHQTPFFNGFCRIPAILCLSRTCIDAGIMLSISKHGARVRLMTCGNYRQRREVIWANVQRLTDYGHVRLAGRAKAIALGDCPKCLRNTLEK